MKKRLLIGFVLLNTLFLCAQNVVDENGLKQGVWSKKYDWGTTRYEGAFKDDKEVGVFRFYDQNGKLISERTYETPGGISNAIMYRPNGAIEAKGKFDGTNKTGVWKYYSKSGYVISQDQYNNGLKDGPEYVFYPDSSIAELIEWKSDQKNGEWSKYSISGKPSLKATYYKDQLHGEYVEYFKYGNKIVKGAYKKGLKDGNWVYYSTNGSQEKMLVYEYGDLIKTLTKENGEIKTIEH